MASMYKSCFVRRLVVYQKKKHLVIIFFSLRFKVTKLKNSIYERAENVSDTYELSSLNRNLTSRHKSAVLINAINLPRLTEWNVHSQELGEGAAF
jgi:hypothetical protein